MIENHLKMNDSKTKFMFFGTRYNLDKHTIPSQNQQQKHNISGSYTDPHLTFKDHITNNSKIALYNVSYNTEVKKLSHNRSAQNAHVFSCTHPLRLF